MAASSAWITREPFCCYQQNGCAVCSHRLRRPFRTHGAHADGYGAHGSRKSQNSWNYRSMKKPLTWQEKYELRLKRTAHRKPLMPFKDAPNGVCRLCGGEATKPRIRWCSNKCLDFWNLISLPRVARRHLWRRDKGHCVKCGDFDEFWEADHAKPLVECDRSDLSAFGLDNLRTLCRSCHKKETSELAVRRAANKAKARLGP